MKTVFLFFRAFGAVGILAYLALIFGLLAGWVMNLIDVVHLFLANSPLTTLFIGKVIGIFVFPLGGVLGWF